MASVDETGAREALVEQLAEALVTEGAGPGNSIHSWRCEYPDRYGPCNCVGEVADELADAIEPLVAAQVEAAVSVVRAEAELVSSLLDDTGTMWRCSSCGWVADERTITTVLWPEACKTYGMVCPQCLADGSFVDHDPLVESVSAKVHEAWMATKTSQGVTSRPSEWGEEQMVPYADLTERAKDLDRGSVVAVLDALRALLAPSPAEGTGEHGACARRVESGVIHYACGVMIEVGTPDAYAMHVARWRALTSPAPVVTPSAEDGASST